MLVLDTETQQSWTKENKRENVYEQRMQALVHDIESNTVTVADDAGNDVSDLLARIGKPMASEQIISKLKLCNPRLHFVRSKSFPELMGIYLIKPGVAINSEWNIDRDCVHICGMQSEISPELSIKHKIKVKKPNRELFGRTKFDREIDWVEVETFHSETRGWRTVLVRLLHAGLINRLQVEQHFGWTPTVNSENWKKQTS